MKCALRALHIISALTAGLALYGATAPGVAGAAPAIVRPMSAGIVGYDAVVLGDRAAAFYRMSDVTKLLHDIALNPKHGNHGRAEILGVPGITSTGTTAAGFPGGDVDPSRYAAVLPNAKLEPSIVSVEAWADASAFNTRDRYEPIVSYGRFSSGTPYQLSVTPINQFLFSVHTVTGTSSVVAATTLLPGRAFHLTGTYDGSSLRVYVNGVLEGQAPASGAIDYSATYPWTGLTIGSGLDALANHPLESFGGTIADVSVYGYALAPVQVMNHYLAGVPTPIVTERAAGTDAFVDSIGVNAPFNYQSTVYDVRYAAVRDLLAASGIRHIRSGLAQTTWLSYYQRLNELAALGIRSQLVTSGTETASQLQAYDARIPRSLEAYEGPNEPELNHNPSWIANTRSFMRLLYRAVKTDPATAKLSVLGPSVVVPAAAAALGDLHADLDYGNIHPYYGPNAPGNSGTGSITPYGRSGSTAYYMNVGAQISGPKPMIVSETGFSTGNVGKGNVSELCDGKEEPRLYFLHFKAGIARSMVYQFVESATAYGALGSFSYMGMLRQDLTPKPSYLAIRSLIALLADAGVPFEPGTLTYRIGGNVNNLEHLLLRKRNGTFYLALWLEVPSWNPFTNQDINAQPQAVSVGVPTTVASGSLYTLGNAGNLVASRVPAVHGTMSLAVTDRITILAFHL
jgi:hypothetical protein